MRLRLNKELQSVYCVLNKEYQKGFKPFMRVKGKETNIATTVQNLLKQNKMTML